jgi:uncharacterized membrane protein YedE/YeeE
MHHFAPLTATLGGVLIGLSATVLWLVNGRLAGISTISGNFLPPRPGETLWRLLFLAGLPLGAWLGLIYGPRLFGAIPATAPVIDLGPVGLISAGLLVGIGTRLANGCTSGHGICGLSRLSPRSVVAVGVFMASAILTVFVMRHVLG